MNPKIIDIDERPWVARFRCPACRNHKTAGRFPGRVPRGPCRTCIAAIERRTENPVDPLAVECPTCGLTVGADCLTSQGKPTKPHGPRKLLAIRKAA